MFLGEGGSGKSSVFDGLRGKEFKKEKNSTMLVDISYQYMEEGKGKWDEMDEEVAITELAKKVVKDEGGSSGVKTHAQAFKKADEEIETVNSQAGNKETETASPQAETKIVSPQAETETVSPQEGNKETETVGSKTETETVSSQAETETVSAEVVLPNEETANPQADIKETETDRAELAEKASNAQKQCTERVLSKVRRLKMDGSSSKSCDMLNVWDCGGQPVFLDIVSAFITAHTVFLLLFDASKDLIYVPKEGRPTEIRVPDSKPIPGRKLTISRIDLMVQWMQLIYASQRRKCKIMMIGSRGDLVDDSKKKNIEESLESKLVSPFRDIVSPKPLIINNQTSGLVNEDPGFGKIRNAVHQFAKIHKTDTPHAWILFRTVLKDTVAEREGSAKYKLSYGEVVTIAESCDIRKKDVNDMLKFYHNRGVFLYYGKLKDTVFIDPQWLFQQMCKLLMPQCYHELCSGFEEIFSTYAEKLKTCGLLQLTGNFRDVFLEVCGIEPKDLVALLDNFDLAKEITQCPEKFHHPGKSYFVPCMLEMHTKSMKKRTAVYQTAATLHISFELDYVPPGFFVRLAAQMTTKFKPLFENDNDPIRRNRITFGVGCHDKVTIFEPTSMRSIEVDFVEDIKRTSSNAELFAESCISFRNKLYEMSLRALECLGQMKLYFGFPCVNDKHFVHLLMKKEQECVSSDKHKKSEMICVECRESLQMNENYKYWLPQVCFNVSL